MILCSLLVELFNANEVFFFFFEWNLTTEAKRSSRIAGVFTVALHKSKCGRKNSKIARIRLLSLRRVLAVRPFFIQRANLMLSQLFRYTNLLRFQLSLLNGLNVQKIVVYVSVLEHKLHYKNPQPFL